MWMLRAKVTRVVVLALALVPIACGAATGRSSSALASAPPPSSVGASTQFSSAATHGIRLDGGYAGLTLDTLEERITKMGWGKASIKRQNGLLYNTFEFHVQGTEPLFDEADTEQ